MDQTRNRGTTVTTERTALCAELENNLQSYAASTIILARRPITEIGNRTRAAASQLFAQVFVTSAIIAATISLYIRE